MDKKKLFAIIAAVVLLFAVVILVVLTKSERPNENEKPSPTPVPTQGAHRPVDDGPAPTGAGAETAPTQAAPVPTAELTATPAPTGTPAPVPTEAATPAPTDEPTPEPTQVAGASPTPALPQLWEEWKARGTVEGESFAEDKTYVYAGHIPLNDGGFMEVYANRPGDDTFGPDFIYVFDTEEMPEPPKPSSPYTKDKESGAVRCAFSVQVGDDVVMEFWTNGEMYLKGTGRTWDFPEIGPNETELGNKIGRVAKDYFFYNYTEAIYNVSTGELCQTNYDGIFYAIDLPKKDFGEFFDSIRTIHIDKRITYIGKNVYEEGQKGLQYRYDFLTAVYD